MTMVYGQRDHDWSEKQLAPSRYRMGDSGCLVTNIAQALTLSGYQVTPGTLCDQLSSNGGFTGDSHPMGGGLMIWSVLTRLYPQIQYPSQGGGGQGSAVFTSVQGAFGRSAHWVLQAPSGSLYDPWTATNAFPVGFASTGQQRHYSIVPAPVPQAPYPVIESGLYPKTGTVTVDGLRVRKSSDGSAKVLGLLYKGEVKVLGEDGDFYRIEYKAIVGISEAYVSKSYVTV